MPYAVSESNANRARGIFGERADLAAGQRTELSRRYTMGEVAKVYGSPALTPAPARTRVPSRPSRPSRSGRRGTAPSPGRASLPRVAPAPRLASSSSGRGVPAALSIPPKRLPPALTEEVPSSALLVDPLFERIATNVAEEHHPLPKATLQTPAGSEAKQRTEAGDLLDSEFMRRFFLSETTLADAQSLVQRLQTLLRIIDREASGFVTWGTFADVIVSLAPPKVLRSSVLGFLDAQADSPNSLIDYAEFVITGKVLILDEFW